MSFIDAHTFSVDLVLRVLGIPPSTYYDWRARHAAPSRRELEDAPLLEMIVKIRKDDVRQRALRFADEWIKQRGQRGLPRRWDNPR